MKKRLSKSRREPEALSHKRITERSIAVIETIGRYRFISTKDIVRLVGGNEDVTHRHLQQLYHRDLISRFSVPSLRSGGEFIYFLDNTSALRKLAAASVLHEDSLNWEQIRQNREKYSSGKLAQNNGVGQFLFIQHELMISAFRADLELASRSHGRVFVDRWMQGTETWSRVQISSVRTLPHRPDAFFTLRFPNAPEGQQKSNFFYEADRNTSTLPKLKEKFEAYLRFLLSGKHIEQYKISKVRAVLVETTLAERVQQMKQIVLELAAKEPLANLLFWFTNSDEREAEKPHTTFAPIWEVAGDKRARSLLD